MTQLAQLTWTNFVRSVYVQGEQRVHRTSASPVIDLFGDGIGGRIGIWLETPPDTRIPAEISRLTTISVNLVNRAGKSFVEVASGCQEIHRQFYFFATAVADSVARRQLSPLEAVITELECLEELLQSRSILSIERQIGLLGELIFLERLVEVHGIDSLHAWVGPLGEPHDYRLEASEYEVKTTTACHRIHTINGENQLLPSLGRTLYLVSILVGPGGHEAGSSLDDIVQRLEGKFSGTPLIASKFSDALEATGFRNADRQHYNRRFVLRRPLAMAVVSEHFPALTRSRISAGVGAAANRVEHVCYDLNIEGLEFDDGTAEFSAAIRASTTFSGGLDGQPC